MKKLWCWLFYHDWQAITDEAEIKAEIDRWVMTGELRMAKCGRCGHKE